MTEKHEKNREKERKKAFFDENSEKMSTKIEICNVDFNPEHAFNISIKDLEKRVLSFIFFAFVVAVASLVI